jgi:hypothetical protein
MDDEFNKYLETYFVRIDKLKNNDRLEIKLNSSTVRVRKEKKYHGIIFSGYGSKNIAKYYVESRDEYSNLIQSMKNGYRRFIAIKSWLKIFNDTKKDYVVLRNLYEVIRSDLPCKPYLDIEWNIKNKYFDDIIDYENNDFTNFYKKMNNDIKSIFKDYGVKLKKKNILWLSSHSDKKISFHIIINKKNEKKTLLYETNLKRCQNSAWDLYFKLTQKDDKYLKILDEAVYSTDREFRLIYSNKNKAETYIVDDMDFRPMVPINEIVDRRDIVTKFMKYLDFKKYLITEYKEYELLDVPEIPEKYMILNKKKKFSFKEAFIFDDDKVTEILKLVRKIHPTAIFTGKSFSSNGYRFTYTDREELCYTGNKHKSNGFMVFYEKDGEINMKCLSENCKHKKILRSKNSYAIKKKLFKNK